MELIRQKHEYGCVVACLAMILNKTYDAVVAESGIDPERGARRWQWQQMLKRNHYYADWQEYKEGLPRPKTWASVHLCNYRKNGPGKIGHMVVIYNGIWVYDPVKTDIYPYENIDDVQMLAAVYPPYFMQPRLLGALK